MDFVSEKSENVNDNHLPKKKQKISSFRRKKNTIEAFDV